MPDKLQFESRLKKTFAFLILTLITRHTKLHAYTGFKSLFMSSSRVVALVLPTLIDIGINNIDFLMVNLIPLYKLFLLRS